MTQDKEMQKRQVAKIVRISDLLAGEYVQQSGWLPNFVRTTDGEEISRVNIVGALTDIFSADLVPYTPIENFSATLDDGSGKMQLRSFEPILFADQLHVGMPVLVVARPKKYSGDLFLVPEIIRKLTDPKWLEVRKRILAKTRPSVSSMPRAVEPLAPAEEKPVEEQVKTAETVKTIDETAPDAADIKPGKIENVLDIIDRLDSGDGVLVEDAVAQIKKSRPEIDAQQRILTLLLNGDLFEIKPGRIKVLK